MHFDYVKQGTGTDVHYTASDAIDSITAAVTQKGGNHAAVGASIMGVPKDVHLVVDPAAGTADWTAGRLTILAYRQ